MAATLTAVQMPLSWEAFDLPNPLQTRSTVLTTGEPSWSWSGPIPDFGIPECPVPLGAQARGWDLDHVVLLVPDLALAIDVFAGLEITPRLRMEVKGRPTAFFRVGPLVEVIESPVRAPALYGLALVTEEALEVVALRWRALGRDVTDPRPAIQPGRRIMTVRSVEAGFAVLSPDRAAD